MTTKNYGTVVSGYRDPEGRNWETTVFQQSKPIVDADLQLAQDSNQNELTRQLKRNHPSGWVMPEFLATSDMTSATFVAPVRNYLNTVSDIYAWVNGWLVRVGYTASVTSSNAISLGAPTALAGARRPTFVFLEVWRRLLSAAPDVVGKSPAGNIWWFGNVKITDEALNFADDILDVALGSESTKRVQIQYRLRVVSDLVDFNSYPFGLDDPTVVANSVPPVAFLPDGNPTAWTYTNQSAAGDPGLWRAGDGNPANTLGTVDGYMYAIPLCAVVRRNSVAFDRNTNHSGGGVFPAVSGRPDGRFSNIIEVPTDIMDLRMAVSPTGWNYAELGEKSFNFLMDNNFKTDWTTTLIGNGYIGHTVFWADEIGVLLGDGTTTGDTPGAEFVGQFDCTRRFFSDRVTYEVLTFRVTTGSAEVPAAAWAPGVTITIAPTAMAQYPYTSAYLGNFMSRAPTGTKVVDVLGCHIRSKEDSAGPQPGCEVGENLITATDPWPIASITGIGTYPIAAPIVITLGNPAPTPTAPSPAISTEPMFIDLLVAYPAGSGLTKTPTDDWGAFSVTVNNIGSLPVINPEGYNGGAFTEAFDYAHRELKLQYTTILQTWVASADCNQPVASQLQILLPERASSLVEYRKNGVVAVAALSTDGRTVTFFAPAAAGDVLEFDYYAIRPIPQSGVQFTIYYEARAPQQTKSSLVGVTQTLIPRWISPEVYTINCGSGTLELETATATTDVAFPFPYSYVQTGGLTGTGYDHLLDGSTSVYLSGFNAESGFAKLPSYIPCVPNPQEVTLLRALGAIDGEGRTYFQTTTPGLYLPSAFSTSYTMLKSHRNVVPAIMETTVSSALGPKGMLVGVLFIRDAAGIHIDKLNYFSVGGGSYNTVAMFRLPGYPLNGKV
jgi:hypothetical protein